MTKPVTYIILSFSILLLTMISRQHHLLPILLCLETRHFSHGLPCQIWSLHRTLNGTSDALVCCKWFEWSLTDFIHGTLSLSNTYFRQHFLNKITDAQRQSQLSMHELLDLHEHSAFNEWYDFAEIRD